MIKDLGTLYQQALSHENLTTALKIIELQAKLEGYLTTTKSKNFSIKELSDSDIDTMIQELEGV
ncbi:hypothetical protein [Candidatus Paracaedibacter symbiosus]|uniref:hypothetical protein n=1 Tax=Candidatus Paracaedibacter symbiosus TaxID=244582 RepID=UPI0018DD8B5F|nr:hypothetical protein [Candidatus Paracaedibacter symbiosus]